MREVRYCGRTFTESELELIRRIVADRERHPHRLAISRAVCEHLGWLRPDGRVKDMSARVALLRMHRDGLIVLPAPRNENRNGRCRPALTAASDPGPAVEGTPRDLSSLRLRPVETRRDSSLWNEVVERYHYLGYVPLPGAQLRYLVEGADQLLGALGMGAAAWKVAPRDNFIGWSHAQREQRLHLVINNARFLILPWVRVRNLASWVLGQLARRVADDWERRYAYRPVLLETFVERDRFRGTCYQAANWIHVGQTQGRGKLDRYKRYDKPIKEIFLYPLATNFREVLAGDPDGFTE